MKTKIILGVLGALAVVLVIAVLIIGAHLGDIVKKGIEIAGPRMTQTTLTVDTVDLSLLAGSAHVKGLVLGNPQGYQAPQSLVVSNAAVSLVIGSVLKQKVVVHSIEVRGLEVTFEGNPFGPNNNLMKILANVEGVSSSPNAAANVTAPAPAPVPGPAEQAKPAKTYEVDNLVIAGARIHANITGLLNRQVTLPLPDIQLTGLGTGPEGITAADLTRKILTAITADSIKALAEYVAGLGKDATGVARQAAQDALKNAGGGVNLLKQGLNGLFGK
jgi:hypothetical protein